jgi:hypothetical protein
MPAIDALEATLGLHLDDWSDSHLGRSHRDAWRSIAVTALAAARDKGCVTITHTAVGGTTRAAGASLTTTGSTGSRAANLATTEGLGDVTLEADLAGAIGGGRRLASGNQGAVGSRAESSTNVVAVDVTPVVSAAAVLVNALVDALALRSAHLGPHLGILGVCHHLGNVTIPFDSWGVLAAFAGRSLIRMFVNHAWRTTLGAVVLVLPDGCDTALVGTTLALGAPMTTAGPTRCSTAEELGVARVGVVSIRVTEG